MNLLPLCTAKVCPTNSGLIVERRDQVLITFLSPLEFNASTFLSRWSSMNGPFFNERGIFHSLRVISSSDDLQPDASAISASAASCNPWSAYPTASPDDVRLSFALHRHPSGGPPGSWPHRAPTDGDRASATHRPCRARCSYDPDSIPDRSSHNSWPPPCASRRTASSTLPSRPLSRPPARSIRPN